MIEEIAIRDLGVIASARLEPTAGFTAVTGETGAGKTMLLTALGLLLGGRSDAALVRAGAERAEVEGRFVKLPQAVVERTADAGGELDDGALILARTVSGGRSRAHLGGRSVPQGVLAELAEHLVTVHGQSDQVQLRSPSRQREVVDAFAGPDQPELLAQVRAAHARVRELAAAVQDARAGERTRTLEIATLRSALEEIDAAEILPGEDEELRSEASRLDNVETLRLAAHDAATALGGDPSEGADGAVVLLERAARALQRAGEHDGTLALLGTQVLDAAYAAAELDAEVGRYVGGLEADPARLDAVHARRAQLAQLARSYGTAFGDPHPDDPPPGSSDAVLAWAEGARARLAALTGPGHDLDALGAALQEAERERAEVNARLTAARRAAGVALAGAVTEELHGLAMPDAEVSVAVEPADPGATGADAVTILLAPHRGAPPRPLGQGASGGELSRVMLALEVALAEHRGTADGATFVFDEVDAGIGGRTAAQVGARLARLARTAQVLVVTHLAQVAAYADRQVVVAKDPAAADGAVTTVRVVAGEERTEELARMLSGETSATARQHAADLLARSDVGRWATP
ncbi:DNA repair protein RecN [Miniimonas arenae]|uniref:DNA repair protein RecN n=1 Tax=Miniimonas arenae TaxID=676201 RepID=A0A5C5BE75_9MICO|nr:MULTISPECIES: DNA repair protein RecN [Miniimonas]TNU76332.1 DNA repair protein RecN [Miniimonas arenae]